MIWLRMLRGALLSAALGLILGSLRRRSAAGGKGDCRRFFYRWQTRGMGLNVNEQLRDTMRPRWIRLRAHDGTIIESPPDLSVKRGWKSAAPKRSESTQ